MQRRMWPLRALLITAAVLLTISCWLGRRYKTEPWSQTVHPKRMANSRGEAIISAFWTLNVYDARTEELLWSARCEGYLDLVADHYLVALQHGKISLIDIDDALVVPILHDSPHRFRPVNFEPFSVEVLGLEETSHVRNVVIAIPGTNRFLVHSPSSRSGASANVWAFEAQSHRVQLLAKWQCDNGGLFVTPDGRVQSVSVDGTKVEEYNLEDFSVKKSGPFPAGVAAVAMHARNYLVDYPDPKSGVTQVRRLDDWSLIPELNFPLAFVSEAEVGDDRRYHIFSDRSFYFSKRLVVYDAQLRRVAFDSGPANGFTSARIKDGHLQLQTAALGETTYHYDLSNGELVEETRPYVWIIAAMPCMLLASLAWLIAWIKWGPASRRGLPLNIVFVAVLFIAPLLWRTGRVGIFYFPDIPTVGYIVVVVFGLFFCLGLYAVFGNGRVLLRFVPLLLGISLLWSAVDHFNLVNLRDEPFTHAWVMLRIWFLFIAVSLLLFCLVRAYGWRIVHSTGTAAGIAREKPTIYLVDFFAATTCAAILVAAVGSKTDLLVAEQMRWFVLGRSALLVGTSSLGLVAFARKRTVYLAASCLAVLVAVFAIADIVNHVAMESERRQLWYRIATDMRDPIFMSLVTFTFCSIMRQSGMRWKYCGAASWSGR